jgi:hypothetical protein
MLQLLLCYCWTIDRRQRGHVSCTREGWGEEGMWICVLNTTTIGTRGTMLEEPWHMSLLRE